MATKPPNDNRTNVTIDLRMSILNTSGKEILNRRTFFLLMGPGGDAFSPQFSNLAGHFYAAIGAHSMRRGSITFEVPAGATSGLQLLYRPEVASEAVLLALSVK